MIEPAGLEVERVHQVNKVSIMAWWFPGKLLPAQADQQTDSEDLRQDRLALEED